jgi:hypothetical protein
MTVKLRLATPSPLREKVGMGIKKAFFLIFDSPHLSLPAGEGAFALTYRIGHRPPKDILIYVVNIDYKKLKTESEIRRKRFIDFTGMRVGHAKA